MSYVTGNQGRPIQGVSQQPEKTRLPGQCTQSDNFRPDVVRGLINRPGSNFESTLSNASTADSTKWYSYSRGVGEEEYFISIEADGSVKAWSPDGTQHVVNFEGSAAAYLAAIENTPKEDLVLYTIGDYTFIINKTVEVTKGSSYSAAMQKGALIYVQYADYSQDIEIYINGSMVSHYRTSDAQDSSREITIRPSEVTSYLIFGMQGLNATLDGTDWYYEGTDITADYSWTVLGENVIHIWRNDGTDFTISVNDDADGDNTVAIKDSLSDTTMLPGHAPEGWVVKINPPGAETKKNASYYLKAENTTSDHLIWKETLGPEICLGMNTATMPHVMVRESITDGVATFTIRAGEWADREVGNDDTNPLPTFCDDDNPATIESVGLFQNRLFFTSGENVIMTRSSDFFNFFRETTQESLDTDPIDVFADAPSIHYMHSHASMDGDLVFFSNHAQFIMDGSKAVTSDNATLVHVTSFDVLQGVDPVVSGDNIFFPFSYGEYSGIREFFTDSTTDTKKARPVTDHVKQYITGNVEVMKTSTSDNLLVVKTDEDQNIIYTYDWLWQGNEKVQSAWGRWIFNDSDKVRYFTFEQQNLHIVIERLGSVCVESIDLGDPPDAYLGFQVRLDRKQYLQMTKSGDTWSVANPYPSVDEDDLVIVRRNNCYEYEAGTEVDFSVDGSDLVTTDDLNEDGSAVDVIIGVKITSTYSPTNPVAFDNKGYALNLDKLIIGAFYMNYNSSGDITATVKDLYGNEKVLELSNRTLGGPENIVGFAPLTTGQHRVPIRKRSDGFTLVYTSTSYLPLEVRDFEYNGNLNRRGGRL